MQNAIVITLILAAVAFVGISLWRKSKAFSTKHSCGNSDCGCGK